MKTALLTAVIAALVACSGEGPPPPPPDLQPAFVVVENASQYVLQELRFHPQLAYGAAPNQLEAPMAVGALDERYMRGSTFVTVFREKFQGGDLLALTTEMPLTFADETGYRVKVFDLSFRVVNEPYIPPPMTSTTATTTSGL